MLETNKNVIKIFCEQGKIQVFPRVDSTKHGIGRGATMDLIEFNLEELSDLKRLINEVFNYQMQQRI